MVVRRKKANVGDDRRILWCGPRTGEDGGASKKERGSNDRRLDSCVMPLTYQEDDDDRARKVEQTSVEEDTAKKQGGKAKEEEWNYYNGSCSCQRQGGREGKEKQPSTTLNLRLPFLFVSWQSKKRNKRQKSKKEESEMPITLLPCLSDR